jgi:hypothetical protein
MLTLAEAHVTTCAVASSEPQAAEDALTKTAWNGAAVVDLLFICPTCRIAAQIWIRE